MKLNIPEVEVIAPNATVISYKEKNKRVEVLVSYSTPIAARYDGKLYALNNKKANVYSNSSCRHYGAFLDHLLLSKTDKANRRENLPEAEIA